MTSSLKVLWRVERFDQNNYLSPSIITMESGWDPQVKRFLLKVMNSLGLGLLWLMAAVTAGIYYKLGYTAGKPLIYTILFYAGLLATLLLLIWYLCKLWKKE